MSHDLLDPPEKLEIPRATQLWPSDLVPDIRNTWSPLWIQAMKCSVCWKVPSPYLLMALAALCSACSFPSMLILFPCLVALILLSEIQKVRAGLGTSLQLTASAAAMKAPAVGLWTFISVWGALFLFLLLFALHSASLQDLLKNYLQLKPSWLPYWACSSSTSSMGKPGQQATQLL